MSITWIFTAFIVFLAQSNYTSGKTDYKPVVIVHGIFDVNTSLQFMASRIQEVSLLKL